MRSYGYYMDFIGMMKEFISKHKRRNYDLCLDLQDFVNYVESLEKAKQIDFITYAMKKWNKYTMGIINGNYEMVDYTEMVWDGYVRHAKGKWECFKEDMKLALGLGLMVIVPCFAMFIHWLYFGY